MHGALWFAGGIALGASFGWWLERAPPQFRSAGASHVVSHGPDAATEMRDLDGTRAALSRLLAEKETRSNGSERTYQPYLHQYLDMLASVQPLETLRLVCEAGLSTPHKEDLLFAIAARWFAREGPSMLDTPGLNGESIERCLWPFFAAVANEAPLEALPRVLALTDDKLRARLFVNLILGANEHDLGTVLDALFALPLNEQTFVLRLMGPEIASRDAERTFEWLEKLTPEERKVLGASVLEMIVVVDPKRALRMLADGALSDDGSIAQSVLFNLAQRDPAAAIAYLDQVDAETRDNVGGEVIRGWSINDPEAATRWLIANEPDSSAGIYQGLANAWALSDLDAALAFVEQLPAPVRSLWIMSLADNMLEQRPDQYLSWVAQFRAEPYYSRLVAQVPLATDDAEAAEALVSTMEPDVRTEALQLLIQRYEGSDPARAATWIAQIVDENVRAANATRLAVSWARDDPVRATAWAQSLPAGSLRDAALRGIVSLLPDSLDLADQISKRDTRIIALLGSGMPEDIASRLIAAMNRASLDERQWAALEASARQTHGQACGQCVQYPVVY
jgi:hypothetical protein